MKEAKLGTVYRPKGNPDYAYVAVRLERVDNTIVCLQLWSNGGAKPGQVWVEPLNEFEKMLNDGEIRRYA